MSDWSDARTRYAEDLGRGYVLDQPFAGIQLICLKCYAHVPVGLAAMHDTWHEKLTLPEGQKEPGA